jgi:hypothetical protein
MALTGRFTFRRSLWGKIVLQVEEETRAMWPFSQRAPFRKRWRNATLMDLAAPELRPLIDLRYKPHFMAQYEYLGTDPERQAQRAEAPDAQQARPGRPLMEAHRTARGPAGDNAVEIERLDSRPRRDRTSDAA